MTYPFNKKSALLLHPEDNVLIARHFIGAGSLVDVDGITVQASETIAVGHKIARWDMVAGTKITRYGAPIGSLIENVKTGEHVHTHNLRSDYIASHHTDAVRLVERGKQ